MKELPEDLRSYLKAVYEANDRIVEQKRRALDPKLREDDQPWLTSEQQNMAAQIGGFSVYFGDGDTPEERQKSGEPVARELFESIVTNDPAEWETWQDVFAAAEKMNKAIEKVLK